MTNRNEDLVTKMKFDETLFKTNMNKKELELRDT